MKYCRWKDVEEGNALLADNFTCLLMVQSWSLNSLRVHKALMTEKICDSLLPSLSTKKRNSLGDWLEVYPLSATLENISVIELCNKFLYAAASVRKNFK